MRDNYKDRIQHLRQVVDYNRCHSQTLPEFSFYANLLVNIDSHISEIKKISGHLDKN